MKATNSSTTSLAADPGGAKPAENTSKLTNTIVNHLVKIVEAIYIDVPDNDPTKPDPKPPYVSIITAEITKLGGDVIELLTYPDNIRDALEKEWSDNLPDATAAVVTGSVGFFLALTKLAIHYAQKPKP